jgi:hypothetical protein
MFGYNFRLWNTPSQSKSCLHPLLGLAYNNLQPEKRASSMKYIMGFHKHCQFLKMNIQVAKRLEMEPSSESLERKSNANSSPITKLHEYEAVSQNPFPGILGPLLLICSIEDECGIHPQAPSGVGDRL